MAPFCVTPCRYCCARNPHFSVYFVLCVVLRYLYVRVLAIVYVWSYVSEAFVDFATDFDELTTIVFISYKTWIAIGNHDMIA